MKDKTKETIALLCVSAFFVAMIVAAVYYVIWVPAVQGRDERIALENEFKNADFNISSKYEINWTYVSGPEVIQFRDTDWYYWKEVFIYNVNEPYLNGKIDLWWNRETNETIVKGDLP